MTGHEERERPDPPGEGGRSRWLGRAVGRRERADGNQDEARARAEVRELRDTLTALRSRLDRTLDELAECRTALALREEQLALGNRESARTTEEIDALRARLDTAGALATEVRALREAAARTPAVVPELIRTADQLTGLRASAATGDVDTTALLRWLDRRLADLLAQAGVETLDDDGPLDLSRHEVVETRPGPPGADPGPRVLATVRPGYRRHGRVLRPQQVIASPDGEAPPDTPGTETETGPGPDTGPGTEPGTEPGPGPETGPGPGPESTGTGTGTGTTD
ncbi:nucleotide exchange factor GrpE [Streptomyces phaeofaciens]|uniref:nucleotide exchange factor GrpE n=1 Tax=Streptomyces phaeofaciens TaxID=68254 RepID=UPI00368948B7